ncbi:MAG: hypothetical protein ACYC1Y_00380 [Minisyncoccota bacterium]
MNKRLVVVIGLPASGKSHLLTSWKENGSVGWVCEDFHANAHNNSTEVEDSIFWEPLIKQLNQGVSCAVADIAFCDQGRLQEFVDKMLNCVTDMSIEHYYFENNKQACIENAKRRARANLVSELKKIDELSTIYVPPPNSNPNKVYKPLAS